jgi:hypothetical protein
MTSIFHEPLTFSTENELTLLSELLAAEQFRLLVAIRHTFHREYREELRRRLDLVERMMYRAEKGA